MLAAAAKERRSSISTNALPESIVPLLLQDFKGQEWENWKVAYGSNLSA